MTARATERPRSGSRQAAGPAPSFPGGAILDPMPAPETNLWRAVVARNPEHSHNFAQRWRTMAVQGIDIDGEARLIDAMAERGSRILDAGCGTGRTGGRLAAAGHRVVGIDLDEHLISVAREEHPGARWEVGDLAEMDLRDEEGDRLLFDLVVCAGNVVTFLAGSERVPSLRAMAEHMAPGARAVIGFQTARGYSPAEFAADAEAAGLRISQRFAGWHLEEWAEGGDYLLAVLLGA